MSRLSPEKFEQMAAELRGDEQLQHVLGEVERQLRIVFHGQEHADWSLAHKVCEQIVIAEVVLRHDGQVGALHDALRMMTDRGFSQDRAVCELAERIHSYYTTPLGIVIRQDLFGERAVFVSPEAHVWNARQQGLTINEHA